ncbi:MAG: 3-isopropylmalate dehydratase small subunit [Candidatus Woesearchaeota archaeon]|jgi:3-isopropylmalate/(R)-2-methylmalate dehydratase small subunit
MENSLDTMLTKNAITIIEGTAIPKSAENQNTDDIVPARFLKEITFKNMGQYAYCDERFKDGSLVYDHPFNDTKYTGGSILLAGKNYGCGSSREHAPQALLRYGINAIIAPSFAEIFAGNCASIGIVGITISEEELASMIANVKTEPSSKFIISLKDKVVKYNNKTSAFEMPEGRRQAFIDGTWDALNILTLNEKGILNTEKSLPYIGIGTID